MNTIVYRLNPGDKKGQMNQDERTERAKQYIGLIKSEGRVIISEEWLSDRVVIVTED